MDDGGPVMPASTAHEPDPATDAIMPMQAHLPGPAGVAARLAPPPKEEGAPPETDEDPDQEPIDDGYVWA